MDSSLAAMRTDLQDEGGDQDIVILGHSEDVRAGRSLPWPSRRWCAGS